MSQDFGTRMGRYAGWQLAILGVLFIVIAAGMYLALGNDTLTKGMIQPMSLMFGAIGLVMVVVAVVLFRKSSGRARVATAGVSGTARILGLTQTGMTLNDQPQIGMDLEVSAMGMGGTYRVTHKEFVPFLLLGRLQPGAVLAVKVNPTNPKQIVILWNDAPAVSASMAAAIGAGPAAGSSESLGQVAAAMAAGGAGSGGVAAPFLSADQANLTIDQLRSWLRENGIAGTARIDRLEDGGQTIGTDRLFTMQTTLEVPGRAPFQGPPSAAMVPVDKMGRIAVGVSLPVKVAPDNPDLTMFEWDKI